jgi:hypothetical protein
MGRQGGGYRRVATRTCVPGVAVCAALSACGGGTERADLPALMEQLPIGRYDPVALIDLDQARDALDLPSDADPSFVSPERSDAEEAFSAATRSTLLHLRASHPSIPPPPIRDALDLSRASGIVSNDQVRDEGMALVVTDQPFDEIAAALEMEGYVRDGDVLSSDRPWPEIFYPHIAGGDGVVALARSPEAPDGSLALAAATRSGAPTDGPARELAARADAPAVRAVTLDGDCVLAVATAERFGDGEATILLSTRDEADPDRFAPDLALSDSGLEPEQVTADGNTLEIEVRSLHLPSLYGLSIALSNAEGFDDAYECPGV